VGLPSVKVPPQNRVLLARLDVLVALVAERHGLALLPDSRLAAAARSSNGTRWSCWAASPRASGCCGPADWQPA
jgi:hypothetical protein